MVLRVASRNLKKKYNSRTGGLAIQRRSPGGSSVYCRTDVVGLCSPSASSCYGYY